MADEPTPADNSSVNATINAVAGLAQAIPVYQDALQPAAKEVGKSLEVVAKVVGIALAPLKGIVWGYERIEGYLNERVSAKLVNTAEQDIITPAVNVAGPAVEAMRFAGEDLNLREMYANLIANSMDKNTNIKTLPAFVEILKSLSSDEALIMKQLATKGDTGLLLIKMQKTGTSEYSEIKHHYNLLARKAGLKSFDNDFVIGGYLDNLSRMGLIEMNYDTRYAADEEYSELTEVMNPKLDALAKEHTDFHLYFDKGMLKVTNMGSMFIDSVVTDKN